MRHGFAVRIGPAGFRVGSAWRAPVAALERLYRGYPRPTAPQFTVRLEPERPWRRFIRPSVAIRGDFMLPDALPMALSHGLLAAEMAMNLQLALGERRFLLLHAASVERAGRALILTGESGAGKSTLAALLSLRGWRLMGDEFALLDPATGLLHAFPRAVSLKNASVAVVTAEAGPARMGPVLAGTPKGLIRHLIPDATAIARMDEPARPAAILFPRFGHETAIRAVGCAEAFVRLTQASTNYVALGEAGFTALTGLIAAAPPVAIDYPDTAAAIDLVERIAAELP